MDPNSFGPDGLQPGDLLEVRAKVIDKHANVTSLELVQLFHIMILLDQLLGKLQVFGITTDASGTQYFQVTR